MANTMAMQGRRLGDPDLELVRGLLAAHPA